MAFKIEFIRSKLARRIFILFVCCALLPVAALSLLSFRHVSKQLEDQGRLQLRQNTRAVGMTIYQRLLFLEDELQLIASKISDRQGILKALIRVTNSKQKFHFKSLSLISESGQHQPIFGQVGKFPAIPQQNQQEQKQGHAVILTQNSIGAPARIFMVMPVDSEYPQKGFVLGEINNDYLWGLDQLKTLPYPTNICVLDPSGNIIASSFGRPEKLVEKVVADTSGLEHRQFTWNDENEEQLGCLWVLFLKSRFLASNWAVVLSQSQGDVLAPMRNLKKIFYWLYCCRSG